ncbi:hypothetical protein EZE20_18605 [Arundinibacter roseus]|uniref:DUF4157 domain-containing protein n=2 Tax=Arundinibacter roseus TaxID=2070510 RepID=A0A4R4K6L6_9BACT|nr:hypothetical protein EZE20_18605 [Arundinibacter roseus]
MKFKGFIIRVSFLWVEGIALFPFVLVKNRMPNRALLNHECIHLRQQLEMGFILFYIWYSVEYFIRYLQIRNHYQAYRRISFEREAFAEETSYSYLRTRSFWAFLKYL